jgi:ferredoxin
MPTLLKTIRRTAALLVFVLSVLFFCDITHRLPVEWSLLMRLQLIPAVLSGSLIVAIVLLLSALLFGRVYCSVLCPMGIFQDLIARLARRGQSRKKKGRPYRYSRPSKRLRYLPLLLLCLLPISTLPWLYLDPYSHFGRLAVNLFRPIAVGANNLISKVAVYFGNYDFYAINLQTLTVASVLFALGIFLAVALTVILRGRLLCNLICPVGALLGLFSRFSLFRIRIDAAKCNRCGRCSAACKAECIHTKKKQVDTSRCVACFNCLSRCDKRAIAYTPQWKAPRPVEEPPAAAPIDTHRRAFLATTTAIAATLPVLPAWAKGDEAIDPTKLTPLTPPGSQSRAHFESKCTACHLCITHCPMQILKPAGFQFGLSYAFKPHLVFYENAFCNYNCVVCTQVCPNGAIAPLSLPDKQVTQIGVAHFDRDLCVVYRDKTSCGACAEHCPVKAVRMEPYTGSLTLPVMYPDLCIGCGGCESICPVRPIKAINVLPSETHGVAARPVEEAAPTLDADELDVGF